MSDSWNTMKENCQSFTGSKFVTVFKIHQGCCYVKDFHLGRRYKNEHFTKVSISLGSTYHWFHRLLKIFSWTSKHDDEDSPVLDRLGRTWKTTYSMCPLITEISGKRLSLFTLSNVQKDEVFFWTWWGLDEKK